MVSLLLLVLAGCDGGETQGPPVTKDPGTMDPVQAAIRTSLDLRGVRPNVAELDAIEADPASLDTYVDTWMADDRFGDRVRDLWSEIYLTRTEQLNISADAYGIADSAGFIASVGEEPLQVLGYIAQNDLPYTDLVTADWTMGNEILAQAFPLDYPGRGTGWKQVHYTDGRPAAGVLASNSLWWRYTSTDSNANRKRANAVSRILLCNDYLVRPIEFDRNVNLLDQEAVTDAIRNNPGCINCHSSLDPMASYLFGFWWYDYTNPAEASYYFPEREPRWRQYTEVPPAYYGEPGYSLADLGHQIAADSRFPQCAAQQAYELLLRRKAEVADTNDIVRHRDAFINGGLTMRALVRSVVQDPKYRSPLTDEQGYVPLKMATPDLLASQIEDLTGFRYTYGGYDMLRSDAVGFRTLAGGADGYAVTATAKSSNATIVLVQERLAEAAAWYVVYNEPERLFTVDFTETPSTDHDEMVAQIQALHRRIFGKAVSAESDEVTAGLELWSALYDAQVDPKAAWAGYLSALLRDPDLLFY